MDKSSAHSNRRFPGKMHRWQRLATYVLLTACFASGLLWFGCADLLGMPPPRLKVWWLLHGSSSLLALMAIGAALPQHVIVTWKARRNVRHGALIVGSLLALALSAAVLLYGREEWHDTVRWAHLVIGIALVVAFPLHIVRGRRHGIAARPHG